jgi:hypothetical protein
LEKKNSIPPVAAERDLITASEAKAEVDQLEQINRKAEIERKRAELELERLQHEIDVERQKRRLVAGGFALGAIIILAGLCDARWDLFPYVDALKLIFAGVALVSAAMGVKQKDGSKSDESR